MRGGEFELLVLAKRGFSQKPIKDPYDSRIDVRDRLAEVLINQGDWNPYLPETVPAYQILGAVSSGLARVEFPEFETLGLYRSLGTALDQYWSTDCFFAIKEGSGYRVVIVDLTLDRFKHVNWMNGTVLRLEAICDRSTMLEFAECVVSFFLSTFSDNDRTLFVDSSSLERAIATQSMKQRLEEELWCVTHPYLKVCHKILGSVEE